MPFPPLGDLPNPGIEPVSPELSGGYFTTEPLGRPVSTCYWSGLPFPSPVVLPDLGIKATSPALAGGFFTIEPPAAAAAAKLLQLCPTL